MVWALASHHADRCRRSQHLLPYFARPADKYPVGQWDYFLKLKRPAAINDAVAEWLGTKRLR